MLILGTKFQLKMTILIFWTKFVQKGISGQKQKMWTAAWNSTYLNLPKYQISALPANFEFLDPIYPKSVFPVQNRKSSLRTTMKR